MTTSLKIGDTHHVVDTIDAITGQVSTMCGRGVGKAFVDDPAFTEIAWARADASCGVCVAERERRAAALAGGFCGDLYCPSCGPAQGNERCMACGTWSMDGPCADPEACAARVARRVGSDSEGEGTEE